MGGFWLLASFKPFCVVASTSFAAYAAPTKACHRAKSLPLLQAKKNPAAFGSGVLGLNPDDDLLSHSLGCTTIGAATFHFRVRDGIGWFHSANFIRETVGASLVFSFWRYAWICMPSKKGPTAPVSRLVL